MAFEHQPGTPIECLSLVISIEKKQIIDPETEKDILYSGFSIGGGIDQDFRQSPYNFPDHGIYVTNVTPGSPADQAGLKFGDKILGCNGMDFTMCTHKQAVNYMAIRRIMNLVVARRGVTTKFTTTTVTK